MITKGFLENRQNLNIESSIPAVISSFEDTGRVRALTKDLKKVSNLELNKIKKLISSFQITEESYSKDEYTINIQNETKT